MPDYDMVNKPSHYCDGKIECIDALEASMTPEEFKGFCKGNTIKYLWRINKKDEPIENAKKAQWYLNKLIEKL